LINPGNALKSSSDLFEMQQSRQGEGIELKELHPTIQCPFDPQHHWET
jgi:hypothetical protein